MTREEFIDTWSRIINLTGSQSEAFNEDVDALIRDVAGKFVQRYTLPALGNSVVPKDRIPSMIGSEVEFKENDKTSIGIIVDSSPSEYAHFYIIKVEDKLVQSFLGDIKITKQAYK